MVTQRELRVTMSISELLTQITLVLFYYAVLII